MTVLRNTVLAAASMLFLAGCATTSPPESGFLTDYSGLAREAGQPSIWVRRNPETTYAEYQRVIIDPFVVGFGPHKTNVLFSAKELDKLAGRMHEAVAKIVTEHYPVVEAPGAWFSRHGEDDCRPSSGGSLGEKPSASPRAAHDVLHRPRPHTPPKAEAGR